MLCVPESKVTVYWLLLHVLHFQRPLKLWPEVGLLVTLPLVGVVEYCDDRVCVPVCTHIFATTYSIFTTFLCMLCVTYFLLYA